MAESNGSIEEVLKHYLSRQFPKDTDSSSALEIKTYSCIGSGNCGQIFDCLGNGTVIKVQRSEKLHLRPDYDHHCNIYRSLKIWYFLAPQLQVPEPHRYLNAWSHKDYSWWEHNGSYLPRNLDGRNALISQRIPPIPLEVKELLVKKYAPENASPQQARSLVNVNCLIRLYLGKKRRIQGRQKTISLKNFPLYLDQIQELGLDYKQYASTMAAALAILHFSANSDGADAEFVLASAALNDASWEHQRNMASSCTEILASDVEHLSVTEVKPVKIWLLDFNLCKVITMDSIGMERAADAFLDNDPYYPRPHRQSLEEQQLWAYFMAEYFRYSSKILLGTNLVHTWPAPKHPDTEMLKLPVIFLESVTRKYGQRMEKFKG